MHLHKSSKAFKAIFSQSIVFWNRSRDETSKTISAGNKKFLFLFQWDLFVSFELEVQALQLQHLTIVVKANVKKKAYNELLRRYYVTFTLYPSTLSITVPWKPLSLRMQITPQTSSKDITCLKLNVEGHWRKTSNASKGLLTIVHIHFHTFSCSFCQCSPGKQRVLESRCENNIQALSGINE